MEGMDATRFDGRVAIGTGVTGGSEFDARLTGAQMGAMGPRLAETGSRLRP